MHDATSIAKSLAHQLMCDLAEEPCDDPRFRGFKVTGGNAALTNTRFEIHIPKPEDSSEQGARLVLERASQKAPGVVVIAPERGSKDYAKDLRTRIEEQAGKFPEARGRKFAVFGEQALEIETIGKPVSWLKRIFG